MTQKLWLSLAVVAVTIGTSVFGREIHITILSTCDLHGNVLPTDNYEGIANLGGIARCASVIKQVRAKERNVLLVDAGDTLQGSQVSFQTDGQVMVKVLNELRYDAWIWGNHEFDWGLDKLAICAERSNVPILNANLGPVSTTTPSGAAVRILIRRQAYIIRDVDGLRVAIMGLNTPGIPNWSRPRLIQGLQFADSLDTLRRIIPEVKRAGAKVLVLVCHQGYREAGDDFANQINTIARNFPELDVIIGAHTHRNAPELKVGGVLYSQADYFGIHLGRADLVFDTERGRISRRSSTTLLMDAKVSSDSEIIKPLNDEIVRSQRILGTVIGEAEKNFGLQGAPRRETSIHNLLFEAIAEALRARGVRVDAIVHGILADHSTIKKGPITIGDVWKVVPYENTIGVLYITEAQFKEILEENASAYDKREFRGVWGVRYTLDPRVEEGMRIVSLKGADGATLDPNRRLAVAFNSYDLAGGGLRWKQLRKMADDPSTTLVEYDFQTRDAVIDYVQRHGSIAPAVKRWWTLRRSSDTNRSAHRVR